MSVAGRGPGLVVVAVVLACAARAFAQGAATAGHEGDEVSRRQAAADLTSPDQARQTAAVIRLATVGRPEDLQRLAALLAEPGPRALRTTVSRALVTAGHGPTVERVVERAGAGRASERLDALVMLRAAPSLSTAGRRAAERALGDTDAPLRLAALEVLAAHPAPSSVPLVAGLLTDGNHEVRLAAIRWLTLVRDPRGLLPLLDRIDAPDRGERVLVIAAVGAIPPQPLVDGGPAVLRQLDDGNEEVQGAAIDALGRLRHAPAVPALRRMALRPARDLLARRAVVALGAIGGDEAIRTLGTLLREAAPLEEVGPALAATGPRAVATLGAVLGDGPSSSARIAAETLAAVGDRAAIPALLRALRTRPLVAIAAARALGTLRDGDSVKALIGFAAPGSGGHATSAARPSEAKGDDQSMPPGPGTRAAVLHALASVGDPRAAAAVAPGLADSDADVRVAALELAVALREGLSLPALARALRDPESAVRRAGVHAAAALPGLAAASTAVLLELVARAPASPPGIIDENEQSAVTEAVDLLESVVRPENREAIVRASARAPAGRRELLARVLEAAGPRKSEWVRLRLRAVDGTPVGRRRVTVTSARGVNGRETDGDGELLLTALPGPGPYAVSVDGAAHAARTAATLSGRSPAITPEVPRVRDASVPAQP